MSEKFCPQCGNKIKEHFKFCPKCGWQVPEAKVSADDAELFALTERMMWGDFADFTRFCELTRDAVYANVRMHGVPESDVEDVCQNVYIDAWQSIEKLSDARAVKGWIGKIAANKSIDFIRSDARRNINLVELPESDDFDGDAYDNMVADDSYVPENLVMDDEEREATRRVLEEAFASISEDKRAILTIRFMDGMKIKDIAAKLEMNESTVKTRIRRSTAALDVEIKRTQKREGVKLRSVGAIPLLLVLFGAVRANAKMPEGVSSSLVAQLHQSIPEAFGGNAAAGSGQAAVGAQSAPQTSTTTGAQSATQATTTTGAQYARTAAEKSARTAAAKTASGAGAKAAGGVAAKVVSAKVLAIVVAVAVAGGACVGVAGHTVFYNHKNAATDNADEEPADADETVESVEDGGADATLEDAGDADATGDTGDVEMADSQEDEIAEDEVVEDEAAEDDVVEDDVAEDDVAEDDVVEDDVAEDDVTEEEEVELAEEEEGIDESWKEAYVNTWPQIYLSYINTIESEGHTSAISGDEVYSLVHVDDDDIPELYVPGFFHVDGDQICTIGKDGSVVECGIYSYDSEYVEKSGLICSSGGGMGYYLVDFIRLSNGEFIDIPNSSGIMDLQDMDENGDVINGTYYWNDQEVSEEDFYAYWNGIMDYDSMVYFSKGDMSASEMKSYLKSLSQ